MAIPSYLLTPKDNWEKKIHCNEKVLASGYVPPTPSDLDNIVAEITKAFAFADSASEVDQEKLCKPLISPRVD